MSTLLLVDFSAVYAIAWHSVGDHEEAGAAHSRTVRMCRDIVSRLEADSVVLCGDTPRNWRHDVYPGYKASRAAKPAGYSDQMRAAWHELAQEVPATRVQGYEADDVIATLAHAWAAEGEDRRVRIITHDKDLEQLVDGQTTIISLRDLLRGELVELDTPAVLARRGVTPAQLGDLLALTGDTSDNVPGVPGVGEKRAAHLLGEHHDLDTVLAVATSEQRPAGVMWQRIAEGAEQARVSRLLVELCAVVPVALPWRAARVETTETKPARPAEEKRETMSDETNPEHTNDHEPVAEPPRQLTSQRYEPEPEPPPTALVKAGDITPSDGMRPTEWSHSLEPTTPRQAFEMARALHDSGLFRSTFPTPSAVFSAMLLARSHGVETMKVLMPGMMHSIKGKLAMSAQMIVGLVLRSGKAEYLECIETSAERAVYVTKRRGGKHEQRCEWTLERARTAGYLSKGDSLWSRDPATMLRHRASTELARMAYPDVVGGLYDPSEFVDANGGAQ
jgi:5'-3' exonuclease